VISIKMSQPLKYWKECGSKTCIYRSFLETNFCRRGDVDCKDWIPIKDIPPIIHRKVVNAILELTLSNS
jgi:hypothetical protein